MFAKSNTYLELFLFLFLQKFELPELLFPEVLLVVEGLRLLVPGKYKCPVYSVQNHEASRLLSFRDIYCAF